MMQTLTTKITVVSIDFQKNLEDGRDLEEGLAALQTKLSSAQHRFKSQ